MAESKEVEQFQILEHLGEGGYASVHLVRHDVWGIVAYKKYLGSSNDRRILEETRAEATRHKNLCDPNIVVLFEAVFNSHVCGLFIEYMKYGTVDQFLKEFDVSLEWRIQIIHEVASAMSYLHGRKPVIIHGDLSCKNILVGDEFHAKIADFGLARILKDYYSRSKTDTQLKGTTTYIAPEYFTHPCKRKSEKFDVYGFAISAWEILSQKQAFAKAVDLRLLPIFVERGERPDLEELDAATPNTIKQLIEDCWHGNENERPVFQAIKDRISDHISEIQSELKRSQDSLVVQERMKSLTLSNAGKRSRISKSLIYSRIRSEENAAVKAIITTREENKKSQSTTFSSPRFREKIPMPACVVGIASLNDELYVVTHNSPDIGVYDIDTFARKRKITVRGLLNAWDIVAHANVLYVSEYEAERIYRIQLSDGTSSHWPVKAGYLRMSINKKGNIVVACMDLNTITEYTPIGSCVRSISSSSIDKSMCRLYHAIQLDDDQFLICFVVPTLHRVCIIDNGRMTKSYGGGEGSGIGQMHYPSYLALDRNGFILVADDMNNRIIQLNASLEFVREFIPASVGLKNPRKMHLREDKKRLYILELQQHNITIFDL